MKKAAFLIIGILIVLLLASYVIYSRIPRQHAEYNEDYILNFIEYYAKNPSDPNQLAFAMDAYYFLGLSPPNKSALFQYLDSQQGDDGSWMTGKTHYVPNTAHILINYRRNNVTPTKSLDPFLSTIDTWDKVDAHVRAYDAGNYWGGLWGYVNVYVVYKNQRPPWTSELLNKIEDKFDDWAYKTHQRNHVAGMLVALSEPLPRRDQLLTITLQKQNSDGGWASDRPEGGGRSEVTETSPTTWFLRTFYNSTPQIQRAIGRGFEFITQTYQEERGPNNKMFAGYSDTLSDRIDPRPTASALFAFTGKSFTDFKVDSHNEGEIVFSQSKDAAITNSPNLKMTIRIKRRTYLSDIASL